MMTKLIDLYYRGMGNLGVWCLKTAIRLSTSWRGKIDICKEIENIEDDLLSSHWKVAKSIGVKLYALKLNTMDAFENEFIEMESIYYGDEETA